MENLVLTPPALKTLPIYGHTQRFPVHRVYCIGHNYTDHIKEMGQAHKKAEPFFFQKNPQNLNDTGFFPLPLDSEEVHHEVELMLGLKKGGENLNEAQAQEAIFGYGIALDMTKRAIQTKLKQQGRPWAIAKAFEHSAPCSPLTPIEKTGFLSHGEIALYIDGVVRQKGDLAQMIWNVPQVIMHISRYFRLEAGDIILTGTPSGVGKVARGEHLSARIATLPDLDVTIC